MDRTGIIVEGYYGATNYSLIGNGGVGISWRNIIGHFCDGITLSDSAQDLHSPVPAGIYNIEVVDDTGGYFVSVSTGDGKNQISQPVEVDSIEVFDNEINIHIIPGLLITLTASPSVGDKFQIIIGGKWLDSEQRIIKSTIFDPLTAGTLPSPSVILKITNSSGKDLKSVYATISNSIHVQQDQDMVDLVTPPVDREFLISSSPIDDVEGEQITRMTTISDPIPYKITTFNSNPVSKVQSDPVYPFSNLGGTFDGSNLVRGWVIADQNYVDFTYVGNNISFEEYEAPYIHYDFGPGNAKAFNRLGICADKIKTVVLKASNENVLEPDVWETMTTFYLLQNSYCYNRYIPEMTLFYQNFTNVRAFRHWKLVITWYTTFYLAFYPDCLTKLARVEFINIPDLTKNIPDRNRPFILIDRETEFQKEKNLQPISDSNNDYLTVVAHNVSTTVDIKIDGVGYDIRDAYSDKLYSEGQSVPIDSATEYYFTELSPLSGMRFILNDNVEEGDFARIWITNGSSVFQIRNVGDPAWRYGRDTLLLTGSGDNVGEMSDGSTCDIELRAFPINNISESDINPTSGSLCIYGTSDSDYEETVTSIQYSAATNLSITAKTIRIRINSFSYIGDEIRFKFRSIVSLNISEAYFGVAQPETPDFFRYPGRAAVTFNNNNSLSLTGVTSQWSDWLSYPLNGDDDFILSYGGDNVGMTYSDNASTFISYSHIAYIPSNIIWDEGYTEYTKVFDLEAIQIRSKYRCLTVIPLVCPINAGTNNLNVKATLIPADIITVFEDFGVSWEEIT